MGDLSTGQLIAISLGGVVLVMVLTGPVVMGKLLGSNKGSKSQDLIPAAETFFLSAGESMTVVRQILTDTNFLGCRYRITYDRMDEGRIQARLYGNPKGDGAEADGVAIDILLNMLFHRLESAKTEVEWSYVVMSAQTKNAMAVVASCNSAFRNALSAAQSSRQSMAEQMLSKSNAAASEQATSLSGVEYVGETFEESFNGSSNVESPNSEKSGEEITESKNSESKNPESENPESK